jgi:hypothetical protein
MAGRPVDPIRETLRELEAGLPAAQLRAEETKAAWNAAVEALAARQQSINSLRSFLQATEGAAPAPAVPEAAAVHQGRPLQRRSRRDVLIVMTEDGPHDKTWTIKELADAFATRRWSLHMERPDNAIKNMVTRLVDDEFLERVRPGAFRLKPAATEGVGPRWRELPI